MTDFTQRIAALSPRQRRLFELRIEKQGIDISNQILPRAKKENQVSLSFAQQRLWFLDQLDPNNTAYNIPAAMFLIGALDVVVLKQSLSVLIQRHETLRTTFVKHEREPIQVIAPDAAPALSVVDLQALPSAEREAAAHALAVEEIRQPFDLAHGPLLRVRLLRLEEQRHVLLVSMHHIIADGWSMGIFVRELIALYTAHTQEQPTPLPELPIQYADYAVWQREWLQGDVLAEQLAYWRRQLADLPEIELPTDRPRPREQSYRGATHTVLLAPELCTELLALAQNEGATLFMLLLAAWQTLLYRYAEQEDIAVGTPIANRRRPEIEGLIGFFVNTLVLRTDLSGNPSFRNLLARVRTVCLDAYAHQDLPFEMLVAELQPERNPSHNPLFQVLFVLQNAPPPPLELSDLTMEPLKVTMDTAKFDLTLTVTEAEVGMQAAIEYSTDLFDAAMIERMAEHLLVLLAGIVAEPEQRLSELPLLPQDEQHHLLVEWGQGTATTSADVCAHELVVAHAARTPEIIAVVCGAEHVSYGELDCRANQLAHYLQTLHIGPEVVVGVWMERSVALAMALLAIAKAGGAYVLLDPSYPPEQLRFMLADTRAPLLLTRARWIEQADGSRERRFWEGVRLVCLDADWGDITQQDMTKPSGQVPVTSLSYVSYSSGKGVPVEHHGVSSCLQWLQQEFSLHPSDTLLQTSEIARDTSIWEIFWPLTAGGRLAIAAGAGQDDRRSLRHLIARSQISVIHCLPSEMSALLKSHDQDSTALCSLRLVLCSGERLKSDVAEAFFAQLSCGLGYLYSVSEAATAAAAWVGHSGVAQKTAAIGRPTNTSIYILDSHMGLVPMGGIGEICIGGAGLARGYKHDEAETARRFVNDPFSDDSGGRLFRSGDRGRWLSDGTLELLASPTRHAWIDGFHVDLAAVEAALLAQPSIAECVVLAREAATARPELVAYVVPAGKISLERWQTYAEATLPASMCPRAYVPISTLPLTATGKVDQQALARLYVVDQDLAQQWEGRLRSMRGIKQVAVVAEERTEYQPLLHISDLLPAWQTAVESPNESHVTAELAGMPAAAPEAMALSDGGPLAIPASAPRTMTEALVQTARTYANKGLLLVQADGSEVFQSYSALLEKAKCILAGLYEQGLGHGDRAILQIETLQDHFAAFWGCVLGGIIPVTVAIAPSYTATNAVVNKLRNIWELLEHPPVLTNSSLVEPIAGLESLCEMTGLKILSVDELKAYPPAEQIHESRPQDVIFYQLTSGSTGTPKCIQETHQAIIAHIHGSAQFNGYTSDDTTLNWLPMDHVVPILTFHLKDVYLGCQQIHVKSDLILAEPLKWLDLMEAHSVSHTWSPNFGFKLISDRLATPPARAWDLSKIKFFMNAGEQVTLPVVHDFLERLAPFGVRQQAMQPAFGMAEVCTCMTYQNDFTIENGALRVLKSSLSGGLRIADADVDDTATTTFVDLGPPIPGVQIRITDEQNKLVPEGVIGRFQIKGDVLMPGYLSNDAANQEAFVGDGWFNSGDLGFILKGRLTLTGRAKEMIIVRGANYYCYEIEDVVNNIAGVEPTYVGACAIEDTNTGSEGLAIFFVPKTMETVSLAELLKTIRKQTTVQLGITPLFIIPLARDQFPKTTSGKIQRAQMKKALMEGDYQDAIKEVDLLLENANTLPDWFYRQIWRPKEALTLATRPREDAHLVFCDQLGLGARMADTFADYRDVCVRVEAGPDFARIASDQYQIDPGNAEHYCRLLSALAEAGLRIDHIFHMWTYDAYAGEISSAEALERAQERGVQSLLFLVQALAQTRDTEDRVDLHVISSYVQPVLPDDEIAYEKAPMVGLINTIPQELPWLHCCLVDLPADQVEENVSWILQELRTGQRDQRVAYRDGQRWVPRLEKLDLREIEEHALPFKPGGMYLISGGAGGIGVEVAAYLLKQYEARVLIVGRTVLPERDAWEAYSGQKEAVSQRIEALSALEPLGGAVAYEAVDICDQNRLREVIQRAKARWGCALDGVIHLAGVFQERVLTEETRGGLAAALHAKMTGTWILHQLLTEQQPTGVFISFSSVNGFFGGATAGAYAAASSFLDIFAQYQQQRSSLQYYCLAWSMWDEVGMSRGYQMKNLTRLRGYYIITPQQGLHTLLASLHREQAHLLVGLDRANPNIRRYLETKPDALLELTAYLTAQADHIPIARLQDVEVPDRFLMRTACNFVQLQQMPLTRDGKLDRRALRGLKQHNVRAGAELIAPRTPLEAEIAQIFAKVLGVERVGVHDDFFELGGHSMLAAQLVAELHDTFQIQLAVRTLFPNTTVASLASFIEGAQKKSERTAASEDQQREELLQSLSEAQVDALLDDLLAGVELEKERNR